MKYLDDSFIRLLIKKRKPNSTKHEYGHALLIAGSKGKMGSAVLASKAVLYTGAGLLTAHIPSRGESVLQLAIPEAMVSLDKSVDFVSELPNLSHFSSIGIGPGIGQSENNFGVIKALFKSSLVPLVIDADAINMLSGQQELLSWLPNNSILTPHGREFERLIGRHLEKEEELKKLQQEWSKFYKAILIRKSHQTVITGADGSIYINTTGNPSLAKGGTGDVLTGMITGFLSQGYSPINAALLATFIHGKAADIAVRKINENSLLATDVIFHISAALNEIGIN
jgi:NAD(P)H-hydrate epimerase